MVAAVSPNETPSFWRFVRHGTFRFYWFPGVTPGIYREYYDGWHLAINLWACSFEWGDVW